MIALQFVCVLLIVLVLIIASFIAGLKLAGYYYRKAESDREYALQRQYSRLLVGADANDPVAPYTPRRGRYQTPPEFDQKLRQNGRATTIIKNS